MSGTVTAQRTCTVADYIWDEPHGWPVVSHDDPGLTPCGEPAIALLTFACVHEHIDGALACMTCAAEIQRVADLLVCQHCEDGPQPHECKTVLRIQWLTEPGAALQQGGGGY